MRKSSRYQASKTGPLFVVIDTASGQTITTPADRLTTDGHLRKLRKAERKAKRALNGELNNDSNQ